jgi:hypothetical protein
MHSAPTVDVPTFEALTTPVVAEYVTVYSVLTAGAALR